MICLWENIMSSQRDTANVFMSRRSRAVLMPRAYRFASDSVWIRREGACVILEPIEEGWAWLDALNEMGSLDADAAEAATEVQGEQSRPGLGVSCVQYLLDTNVVPVAIAGEAAIMSRPTDWLVPVQAC